MNIKKLPFKNLRAHGGRTLGMMVLVALLSLAVFGGSAFISGLQNGLSSLETRLGADIIVAPQTAEESADLESVLLEGVPGFFYMDQAKAEQVAAVEGVEQASPQYFLATAKAGCCSMPLQIIGYDPKTDFSVTPWIAQSYAGEVEHGQVVIGSGINAQPGGQLKFYGITCDVAAQLDETGTKMDYAVFCNADTIKDFIAGSREQGILFLEDYYPDDDISTVQVRVADGQDIQTVADAINDQVEGVTAVTAKSMTSGIADGMAGVSRIITVLMVLVWVLAAAVLAITYLVLGKRRIREFAVLRVVGASRSQLTGVVMKEALVTGLVGGVVGILLSLVLVLLLRGVFENTLGLPFLLPSLGKLVLLALLALAIAVVASCAASAVSARKLSRADIGLALREE